MFFLKVVKIDPARRTKAPAIGSKPALDINDIERARTKMLPSHAMNALR